jgi:mono/diheme cytochrome c family protein
MHRYYRSIATIGLCAGVVVSGLVVGTTLGFARFMQTIQRSSTPMIAMAAKQPLDTTKQPLAAQGAKLFSFNCAQCHGVDATGDEGPDLHGLTKSDSRLKSIILNGVKGEMPAFNKKFKDEDAQALVAFLRTLKS